MNIHKNQSRKKILLVFIILCTVLDAAENNMSYANRVRLQTFCIVVCYCYAVVSDCTCRRKQTACFQSETEESTLLKRINHSLVSFVWQGSRVIATFFHGLLFQRKQRAAYSNIVTKRSFRLPQSHIINLEAVGCYHRSGMC